VATVYGNSYFNSTAPNMIGGYVIVEKCFIQNNYSSVYFTSETGPHSAGVNNLTGFCDVNSVWTMTLCFIQI
jgi:hypothetical protein